MSLLIDRLPVKLYVLKCLMEIQKWLGIMMYWHPSFSTLEGAECIGELVGFHNKE